MTIKIGEKEYIVKFGYNSFCDSDLLDRTAEAMGMIQEIQDLAKEEDEKGKEVKTTAEVLAKVRNLFMLTRELLFEGFKKKNPVTSISEVGDILDAYLDEDKENHGLITIFAMIAQELLKEGFFGNLLTESGKAIAKMPKKSARKKN
ncbi:MAG: hypothetical protein IKN54_03945 [Lachnospiraceae bacterium]|nr:hypothetical protein [Lachnospiraceae bacterium]